MCIYHKTKVLKYSNWGGQMSLVMAFHHQQHRSSQYLENSFIYFPFVLNLLTWINNGWKTHVSVEKNVTLTIERLWYAANIK